jgi:putative redox protein
MPQNAYTSPQISTTTRKRFIVSGMPKIKARAKLVENLRSIVDNSRTHSIVCDQGPAKGGQDSGPKALELALMALADCAVTIFADVAKQSKIEITKLEAVAEAEKSPDSPKLSGVKLKVLVSAKARKQLLEAAWRRTEANCPVITIFKEPISIEVELETATVE